MKGRDESGADDRPIVVGIGRETRAALAYGATEAMARAAPLLLVGAAPRASTPQERHRLQETLRYRLALATARARLWTASRVEVSTEIAETELLEALVRAGRTASMVVVEGENTTFAHQLSSRTEAVVVTLPAQDDAVRPPRSRGSAVLVRPSVPRARTEPAEPPLESA